MEQPRPSLRWTFIAACVVLLFVPFRLRADGAENPVLLIHGFCSGPETWDVFRTNMKSLDPGRFDAPAVVLYFDGTQVVNPEAIAGARLFTLRLYNPIKKSDKPTDVNDIPITGHAFQLRQVVEEIWKVHGRPMDIIGHSMGGLVARAYVEGMARPDPAKPEFAYPAGRVRRIVTIDTPHLGSFLAGVNPSKITNPLCYLLSSENKRELQPGSDFLRGLNTRDIPRSVSLVAIGSRVIRGPGTNSDGVVPLASQTLESMVSRYLCASNVHAIRNDVDQWNGPLFHMNVLDIPQTAEWVHTWLSPASLAPKRPGYLPVAGDWNGDGIDTIGVYDPVSHRFLLRNSNSSGPPDLTITVPGDTGPCRWPVVGDWDGNGLDTPAVYDPTTRKFLFTGARTARLTDFGPKGSQPAGFAWLPVAGDWDASGSDTVGLFDPLQSVVYYKRDWANGSKGLLSFSFPRLLPRLEGERPLVGAWALLNEADFFGLYIPWDATFRRWSILGANLGPPTIDRLGPPRSDWWPIVGNWSHELRFWGIGLYDSSSSTFHLGLDLPEDVVFQFPATGAPCYGLSLSHTGQGSEPTAHPGSSTGCPAGRYTAGALINLTASPAPGWLVQGWSGTSSDASASATNSLVMPAADHAAAVRYAAQARENLLTNPGFDASLSGWDLQSSGSQAVWDSLDTGSAAGSGSARVTVSRSGGAKGGLFQCVSVTAGTAYAVSARLRIPPGQPAGGHVGILVNWYPGPCFAGFPLFQGTPPQAYAFNQASSTDRWLEVSAEGTAPAGAKEAVVFLDLSLGSSDLSAYFDDIRFGRK